MHYSTVEGLLIRKALFRERDIMGTFLLRNGKKISVAFYGGAGGGSKKKSGLLEVGHLLGLEVGHKKKDTDEENALMTAKEWSLKWSSSRIRLDYSAYALSCFFLEFINKVAQENHESVELFRLLSNALYYMDHALEHKNFSLYLHANLFLVKAFFEQGIAPQIENCLFCEVSLIGEPNIAFLASEGGFVCSHCAEESAGGGLDLKYWQLFDQVRHLPYANYQEMERHFNGNEGYARKVFEGLLNYWLTHHQMERGDFKTLRAFS